MNDFVKYGLFFVGGILLGAVGSSMLGKGKMNLKPIVTDVMSRGMDIRDAIAGKVEAIKEDAEDMVAAAKQRSDQRKVDKATEA